MKTQTKKRLPRYDNLHRTTVSKVFEEEQNYAGVYVLAYMGQVLYVGKAEADVSESLNNHMMYSHSRIGIWLRAMQWDWSNVRIDILEPTEQGGNQWIKDAEIACIKHFLPLFNDYMMPQNSNNDGCDNMLLQKHNQESSLIQLSYL